MARTPTNENQRLTIIGAVHVDDIASTTSPLVPKASNPVSWRQTVGGVAANAALAAIHNTNDHQSIVLICAAGEDAMAIQLDRSLQQTGLSTQFVSYKDRRTGRYTAILDYDQELFIGLADVATAESLTLQDIEGSLQARLGDYLLIDANLSASCIHDICQEAHQSQRKIMALCVSPTKAKRLINQAPMIDVIICNRREAHALSERCPLSSPLEHFALELAQSGFKRSVITDGPNPICVSANGESVLIDLPTIEQTHAVNGAGDALAGATFVAWADGKPLADAVRSFGIQAAINIVTGVRQPLALN